jgi:hypothetical protein
MLDHQYVHRPPTRLQALSQEAPDHRRVVSVDAFAGPRAVTSK